VVVGRWGISKLKDLVWGSIANKLIGHMVHTPLWVVGTSPQPGKVLLAMDGSEEAMRTVDYVGAMLRGTEWEITLFHVIRGFDFLSVGYEGSVAPIQQVTASGEGAGEYLTAEDAIREVFENGMDRLRKAGLNGDLISTKVTTGVTSRAKAIVEEARTGDYGTIVVGRRGLSRVDEFLMGRVSSKVAQLAKEPAVWIVV
jgi:nucleotide-binding universal stress UspA family protein